MEFLYTTDLHGNIKMYESVKKYAVNNNIKLIHLGADLLPKGKGLLKIQKKFIKGYLKNFFSECNQRGIKVLAFFGNDDIYTRKELFRMYSPILDETTFNIDEYLFKAYGYVPDYPFGLKSACKLDYDGWILKEPYISTPVEVDENGFYEIEDIGSYFKSKGTIEEDLKNIKGYGYKLIMAIHCPPDISGLDSISTGQRVGSVSVRKWIEQEQPLLVLCGHIHESYAKTRIWSQKWGDTLVIQPGQGLSSTHVVHIKINGGVAADFKQLPL